MLKEFFSFKGFVTNDKNTHLEHLEDDIINRGAIGGDNAINFLKSVKSSIWIWRKYNLCIFYSISPLKVSYV